MRIWFAANVGLSSRGGVLRSMHELHQRMRSQGHEARVVLSQDSTQSNYITFALRLGFELLKSLGRPPDWIVARSTDGLICAALSRLLRLRTKVALHNHGWEEHVYEFEKRLPKGMISSPTTWKSLVVRFPLLRLCLRLCHCCLCGTLYETRWLGGKYTYAKGKTFLFPNGVSTQPSPRWTEGQDPTNNFLFVGGRTWKKNIEYAIDLFDALRRSRPDASLHVVGPDDTRGNLPTNSTPARVHFHPSQTMEEMDQWYRKCPYLIATSRYEGGHPFTILEAMSHGLIVIASDIFAHREIVADRKNGIIISGTDSRRDALAIASALEDPDAEKAMRLGAVDVARRNRWERQVTRLINILEKPS